MARRPRATHAEAASDGEPPIVIRSYDARDTEAVWALHREGVMETTPQYPEVDPKYEDDLRNIEREYLWPGSKFWVAQFGHGGPLIGMVAVRRLDTQTARLRRMRVTASWRRKGLGRRLVHVVEDWCREQAYIRIILDTTEHQAAAHRLYERAGFTRSGERTLGPLRVFDYEKRLR